MIKVWFLMVLMSYPNVPAITYKGFGGFFEKEECEDNRILVENIMDSHCIEFESFYIEGLKKANSEYKWQRI